MPLFLAVSVPGFTALLSLGGVRPGKQTRDAHGQGWGRSRLQILPGQLPVLPFIYSQAASISQVVQGLGVLSIYLGTFSGSGWQAAPSIL